MESHIQTQTHTQWIHIFWESVSYKDRTLRDQNTSLMEARACVSQCVFITCNSPAGFRPEDRTSRGEPRPACLCVSGYESTRQQQGRLQEEDKCECGCVWGWDYSIQILLYSNLNNNSMKYYHMNFKMLIYLILKGRQPGSWLHVFVHHDKWL